MKTSPATAAAASVAALLLRLCFISFLFPAAVFSHALDPLQQTYDASSSSPLLDTHPQRRSPYGPQPQLDSRALAKRFTATFVVTNQSETLCGTTTTLNNAGGTGGTPNATHCALMGVWAATIKGYWELGGWYSSGDAVMSVGTCEFRVDRGDGGRAMVRIGNSDLQNLVYQSVQDTTKNKSMNATAANIKCYDAEKGDQGATLIWTVQDPSAQDVDSTQTLD